MALSFNQVGILKNEEIQNMSGILLLLSKTQSAGLWGEPQVRRLWVLDKESSSWTVPCMKPGNLSPTTARTKFLQKPCDLGEGPWAQKQAGKNFSCSL